MFFKLKAYRLLGKLNGHLDFASLESFISAKGWNVVSCEDREEFEAFAIRLSVLNHVRGCDGFTYEDRSHKAIFILSGKLDNIALLREICHIMYHRHNKTGNLIGSDLASKEKANKIIMQIIKPSSKLFAWYRHRKWLYAVLISVSIVAVCSALVYGFLSRKTAPASVVTQTPYSSFETARPSETGNIPENIGRQVYVTKSGNKYHKPGCAHLTDSAVSISIEKAIEMGYEPCKSCLPQID